MIKNNPNKFIYHRKLPIFKGDFIYPLNELKNIYPDAYELVAGKYQGREELINKVIPGFNVLWNNVVQCSPIHPAKIVGGLILAGRKKEEQPETEWFKIPLEKIKGQKAIYYKYKHWSKDNPFEFLPEDFEEFDFDKYQELEEMPEKTLQDFKQRLLQGKKPFLFHLIPHILVLGKIDIRGVEIIRI